MSTIRARLTTWNGGVLVCLLCVFALAAYLFLRHAALAQVDRALSQQVSVVELTAKAHGRVRGDSVADLNVLVKDLEVHGLLVMQPPSMPGVLVTAPVRIEQDEADVPSPPTRASQPEIDVADLNARLIAVGDADAAFSVRGRRGGVRALAERVVVGDRVVTLVATQPMHETEELLETARDAALVALPLAILLALAVGYALARQALDPIAAMTSEAQRIGARTLHERLSVRNAHDELGQLARTFNTVLERADLALAHQRRFTADASHELRTPIAVIRAEADVALSGTTASEEEYRAALRVIRDGSNQLSRIVSDLFLLARADAGQSLMSPLPIYLDELVTTTVHGMRALADRKKIELRVHVPGDTAYTADEELLRRALRNLVDNAIKYATGPGVITVSLERDEASFRISVADDGPGISSEDQGHIFERFFRGDSSRAHSESDTGAGAGLGLAIAREIGEMHGGSLTLLRSDPSGSTFELVLPLSP